MKENDFLDGISNIEPDVVERFISMDNKLQKKANKPKSKVTWLRLGAIAACFVLIFGAVIIGLMLRKDEPGVAPDTNNNDRYKNSTILSTEYGIIWPWKYQTVYEKYSSIDIDGAKFIGRSRELPASYVGKKIGSYKATGYDDTSDDVYHEYFDAYEIKNIASDRLIAVNMENHYYIFISENYNPPATWGGVLEVYSLSQYIELNRFSVEEKGKDKTYRLLNDDSYIWNVLKDVKDAEAADSVDRHENRGNFISFTITSEALGVYKKAMYITENGYVWTNIFDFECLYFIGDDAAGKIIKYAKENSTEAEFEPYNKTIAGEVVEITDDYILIDDSILCKEPADGITYKVIIDGIKISRYIDCNIVKVGSTVVVSYEGDIDVKNGNSISKAILISEGVLFDGDVFIPE